MPLSDYPHPPARVMCAALPRASERAGFFFFGRSLKRFVGNITLCELSVDIFVSLFAEMTNTRFGLVSFFRARRFDGTI